MRTPTADNVSCRTCGCASDGADHMQKLTRAARTPARSFKAALVAYRRRTLTPTDRENLDRWLADGNAADPIWRKIAVDARARGIWPAHAIERTIIFYALEARRIAEAVGGGDDPWLHE